MSTTTRRASLRVRKSQQWCLIDSSDGWMSRWLVCLLRWMNKISLSKVVLNCFSLFLPLLCGSVRYFPSAGAGVSAGRLSGGSDSSPRSGCRQQCGGGLRHCSRRWGQHVWHHIKQPKSGRSCSLEKGTLTRYQLHYWLLLTQIQILCCTSLISVRMHWVTYSEKMAWSQIIAGGVAGIYPARFMPASMEGLGGVSSAP